MDEEVGRYELGKVILLKDACILFVLEGSLPLKKLYKAMFIPLDMEDPDALNVIEEQRGFPEGREPFATVVSTCSPGIDKPINRVTVYCQSIDRIF